jgi:hypothetical protein
MTYRIESGIARARRYPATFQLPPAAARENLQRGDVAKMIFEQGPYRERMWVEVEGREGHRYRGQLRNEPVAIEGLHWGDPVRFGPADVIDIDPGGTTTAVAGAVGTFVVVGAIAAGLYYLLRDPPPAR